MCEIRNNGSYQNHLADLLGILKLIGFGVF